MTGRINPHANDISHYLVAERNYQNLEAIRYDRISQAIGGGNISLVKELIRGVDRTESAICKDQEFVLCEAMRLDKLELLQTLLIDTDINILFIAKLSVIDKSIQDNKSQALRILLQYTNISDESRNNAIDEAIELEHFACAKELGWRG